jgi:hypothetical protein
MKGCTCQTSSINHFLHCPFPWLLMLIPKTLILMMWCLCFSFLIFTLCFVIRHKYKSLSVNTPTPRSQWMTFVVVNHHTGKCIVSYWMLIFSVYSGWQQYCVCARARAGACVWACAWMRPHICVSVCVCVRAHVFHNTMTKFQGHAVQVT